MNAEEVREFFRTTLSGGRLAHAYLLLGEDDGLAEELAGLLLCRAPDDGRACGRCTECRQLAGGFHPDLMVVTPAPNSIKIEQIRDLLKAAYLSPYQADRKVFVLKEARKMTSDAANCLLKLLEEPAEGVFFILTADRGEELLPTVVSRCQKFNLTGPGVAGEVAADRMGDFLEALAGRDVSSLLRLGETLGEDKNLAADFLNRLTVFYRDQAVRCETGAFTLDRVAWEESGLAWNDGGFQTADLIRCFDRVESAKRGLTANANARLLFDSLFLYLAGEA